jgi:drug/metabolite transporter (DMT)-like permease
MTATRNDYFKLHFIVFLWGFSSILGKLISLPTIEMVLYRSIIAVAGMGVLIFIVRGTFKVTKIELVKLILIGFVVALHWVSFFGSGRVSNISVSLVGFATNSLWAALLEPLFNRTRIKKFELFLGLVVILGLYIIFSFDFQYKLGLLIGVLSGFTAALFSVFNSKMIKTIDSYTITFYEMIGVFIGLTLFMPIYKNTWAVNHTLQLSPSLNDWIYLVLLAVGCSVYAYSQAVELMKKLSVFVIQLSLNLEPVYGIIMAVIIFKEKEKMGVNFYAGTLIILLAVALYPLLKNKLQSKQYLEK